MKDVKFNSEKKGKYYPIHYLNFLTCSNYGLLGYDAVQSYQWIPFWRNMAPPSSQVWWWVRRQCIKGRIQGRCPVRFTDGREENVVRVNTQPPFHCFYWLRLQCTSSPFFVDQISHLPCTKPAQSTESLNYSFWSGRWKQYVHLKCLCPPITIYGVTDLKTIIWLCTNWKRKTTHSSYSFTLHCAPWKYKPLLWIILLVTWKTES